MNPRKRKSAEWIQSPEPNFASAIQEVPEAKRINATKSQMGSALKRKDKEKTSTRQTTVAYMEVFSV